jgi:hypothetical protein
MAWIVTAPQERYAGFRWGHAHLGGATCRLSCRLFLADRTALNVPHFILSTPFFIKQKPMSTDAVPVQTNHEQGL